MLAGSNQGVDSVDGGGVSVKFKSPLVRRLDLQNNNDPTIYRA